VQRWITAVPVPCTRADAEAFVDPVSEAERRSGSGMNVAIEADGVVVGVSGVHRIGVHPLGPEIGCWRLVADVRSTGSEAVARRADFVQEGVLRSYLDDRDGGRADAALFSRLPGDSTS